MACAIARSPCETSDWKLIFFSHIMLPISLIQNISWAQNVEVRPHFCGTDVYWRRKHDRDNQLSQNTLAQTKNLFNEYSSSTFFQIILHISFNSLCPCYHCFSFLVSIFLSTFAQSSSLTRCMCGPMALSNYWRRSLRNASNSVKRASVIKTKSKSCKSYKLINRPVLHCLNRFISKVSLA